MGFALFISFMFLHPIYILNLVFQFNKIFVIGQSLNSVEFTDLVE